MEEIVAFIEANNLPILNSNYYSFIIINFLRFIIFISIIIEIIRAK
jgi:hypothetical protein